MSFVQWKPCLYFSSTLSFWNKFLGQYKLCLPLGFISWLIGFIHGSREQIKVSHRYPLLSERLAVSIQSRFSNDKITAFCKILKIYTNYFVLFFPHPFSFVIFIHSSVKTGKPCIRCLKTIFPVSNSLKTMESLWNCTVQWVILVLTTTWRAIYDTLYERALSGRKGAGDVLSNGTLFIWGH